MADPERGEKAGYWVRYLLASAVVLGAVWALVTRVLPPRILPTADFRERAVRFSTDPPDFDAPARVILRSRPEPAPPAPSAAEPPAGERMGPRGRLWEQVLPLLEANRFGEAIPLLERYLARHPGDRALRLELARALLRAGRPVESESQFRRLAEAGEMEGILGLARVHWRRGRDRAAARQLRRALERRPEDGGIRSSLARALRAAGAYGAAADQYRRLIEATGRPEPYRLELARTLLWAGDPRAALAELRTVEGPEARALAGRIGATLSLPAPDPVPVDPLVRARLAREAGRLQDASSLYRLATDLRPDRSEAWLEWSDLLATRLGRPGRAAELLEEHLAGAPARPAAARRRLARYAAWSGREASARGILEEMARQGRAEPRDLLLLADLLRWADRRGPASRYYRRVLSAPGADSAAVSGAERGLRAVRARDRQVVASRDPRRLRVSPGRLDDSDGLGRTDLAAEARFGAGGRDRLTAAAGWTRVEGARVPGSGSAGYAEAGYLRWLDHATARLALSAGAERRSGAGAPRLAADLLLLDRVGDRLRVEASRRPAHRLLQSLGALRRGQEATGAAVTVDDRLGRAAGLRASVRADALEDVGAGGNLRLLGTAAWERAVADRLRLGASTRLLSFTSPAFRAGGRPGYWSPELSWTPSAVVDWRLPAGETGWGLHARLQPGLSVVREHGRGEDARAGTSLSARGAALYRWPRATAEATLGYVRSRAGEYDLLSAGLSLTWRF